MNRWISKGRVLVVSALLFAVFTGLILIQGMCDYESHGACWQYWDQIGQIGQILEISVPLLLLSVLIYFLQEEVFRAWTRFAIWWVPISMIVIVVSPDNDSTLMAPTTREIFSILSLGLFVLISLIIIVTKWIRVRKK